MSTKNDSPIHVFNNAFFSHQRRDNDLVFLNSQGEEAKPTEDYGQYFMFKGQFKDFSAKNKKVAKNVAQYVPLENFEHMKTLSTEEYETLSSSFQDKYKKIYGEDSITYTPAQKEIIFYEHDFDDETYNGEKFFNKVHEIANTVELQNLNHNSYMFNSRNKRNTIVGFGNFLSHDLDGKTLFAILKNIYSNSPRASEENPVHVNISFSSGMMTIPHRVELSFYEHPYKGEHIDVKLKKKDGKYYADGRSKSKPAYPKIISRVSVDEEKIMSWWNSIEGDSLTDERKLEVLTELTAHLQAGAQ